MLVAKVNEQHVVLPSSDAFRFARSAQIVLPAAMPWRSEGSAAWTTMTLLESMSRARRVPVAASTDMTVASSAVAIEKVAEIGAGASAGAGAGAGATAAAR